MKVLVADPVGEEGIDILCARAGVGVDNIDVEEATRRGIAVVNAPFIKAASIAGKLAIPDVYTVKVVKL